MDQVILIGPNKKLHSHYLLKHVNLNEMKSQNIEKGKNLSDRNIEKYSVDRLNKKERRFSEIKNLSL